ncbi:hypothetical protein KGQ20_02880 [Catenulispora sp. NF23]|uniref:AfsR/SARP family transcriptional regulator n=1 Tax=Catenulispora pinistramenti TaxID=2705254 RepID=UPI001BAA5852|nr:BTAD domain-containing putative transcriptional regulator [Catenulispora pinistramenti]MBS2531710.1 hypothetical protein [Catenulispora pinistramenti]
MSESKIRILGPVRAEQNGESLRLGPPQQQAVLVMLLLAHGGQVSVDSMIDGLWGESPPKSAVGIIRKYISGLRKPVGAGEAGRGFAIVFAGNGYVLSGSASDSGEGSSLDVDLDIDLDLDRFESDIHQAVALLAEEPARARALCRKALLLWRGPPLAGITGPFAEGVRARTTELYIEATQTALTAQVNMDDQTACAIARIRRLIEEYPLRESLYELLMLALHKAGRPGDALDAYTRARRTLRDELGIGPGPGLRAMQRRILVRDVSPVANPGANPAASPVANLATSAAPIPAQRKPTQSPAQAGRPDPGQRRPLTSALVVGPLPASPTDFTGRADLLAAIRRELCEPDGPRVVALRGGPGIGKTSLALRAAHLLAPAFPDGQIYVKLTEPDGGPMSGAAVLTALLRATGLPVGEVPPNPVVRAWALRGLLATHRVLVILDDVDSVRQIQDALAAPPGSAFLVTGRDTLPDLGDAVHHEVPRLNAGEAFALLEALIGTARVREEPDAARALASRCAGHPPAIRELATGLASRPGQRLGSALKHLSAEPEFVAVPERVAVPGSANSAPWRTSGSPLSRPTPTPTPAQPSPR